MEFALTEEQRLFADSLRGLLADRVSMRGAAPRTPRPAPASTRRSGTAWSNSACRACWCRSASAAPGSACWMRRWRRRRLGAAAAFAPFAASVVMATARLHARRDGGTAGCLAAAHRGRRGARSASASRRRADAAAAIVCTATAVRRRAIDAGGADASAGLSGRRQRRRWSPPMPQACRARCIAASIARDR